MTSIKEMAQAYESPKTNNIAELSEVSVDLQLEEKTFQDKEGKDFTITVTNIGGDEYRVPASVVRDLKAVLEKRPDLQKFSVGKSGEGLGTKYTVIAL